MFFAYSLLFTLGLIVTAPFYVWRYRGTSQIRASLGERLGRLAAEFNQAKPGCIWIHAVSVGETLAVSVLVNKLQTRFPGRKIFISHVTPTGRAAGESRLAGVAGRFYAPLDWNFAVHRVLDKLKPALLVIVETELWPNLIRAAHQRAAAAVLVNARLSDRSLKGYRLARPFMRKVLESLDAICAQSEEDAKRFRALGARPDRVSAAGNLKFDFEAPPPGGFSIALEGALRQAARSPVLIAASTMPGEEMLVVKAWHAVCKEHPKALLILAPRHPARFNAVAELLQAQQGQACVRRTSLGADKDAIPSGLASAGILLLDTIGELAGMFRLADLVFMGGTLVPRGGHNILEPAYWGKPILFGPHMENFREISRLFLAEDAAIQVEDEGEMADQMLQLLGDEPRRKLLGESARRALEKNSGASDRIVETLSVFLAERETVQTSTPGGMPR
ncbi:MAG: 3-deoxy-D-manno-octulosonic acid transferase [Terriglobia bacterium]